MFDTFDQRLFILARAPAMAELLGSQSHQLSNTAVQTQAAAWMTSIFIAGWATGGLIFGIYGDRLGRVRTMAITIAIYSLFTGLSATALHLWDFGLYRFLTGVGIGGEFAAGASLIAEILPARLRPYALGFMQAVAMLGTLLGTLCSMGIEVTAHYQVAHREIAGWRLLFMIGALPALVLIPLRLKVEESESWLQSREAARRGQITLGGFRELLRGPWRRASLVGIALGFAGQLGIWAIGTWSPELMRLVLAADSQLGAAERSRLLGMGLILKDVASAMGIMLFAWAAERYGRRPAFAASLVSSLAAGVLCFAGMHQVSQFWWMMPLLGFSVWSVLGGYSLYFPELFPTRLRASGVGLCYNVARYLTAIGILAMGQLLTVFAQAGYAEPLRPAAIVLASGYLVGLVALVWAPETRGQPLPE
jgi:MFS family permease